MLIALLLHLDETRSLFAETQEERLSTIHRGSQDSPVWATHWTMPRTDPALTYVAAGPRTLRPGTRPSLIH